MRVSIILSVFVLPVMLPGFGHAAPMPESSALKTCSLRALVEKTEGAEAIARSELECPDRSTSVVKERALRIPTADVAQAEALVGRTLVLDEVKVMTVADRRDRRWRRGPWKGAVGIGGGGAGIIIGRPYACDHLDYLGCDWYYLPEERGYYFEDGPRWRGRGRR